LQTKLLFDSESRGKAGSLELLPDQSQNTVLLGNLPDYYRWSLAGAGSVFRASERFGRLLHMHCRYMRVFTP